MFWVLDLEFGCWNFGVWNLVFEFLGLKFGVWCLEFLSFGFRVLFYFLRLGFSILVSWISNLDFWF